MKGVVESILHSCDDRELKWFLCGNCGDNLHDKLSSAGIKYECIDRYGGEDLGSDYWRIYSLTNADGDKIHIKLHGYYSSYEGVDYHNFYFVKPVQVMTTQWESDSEQF